MQYKYADYIAAIEHCPPDNYRSMSATVYRWVHEDLNHPNDFLPVALINPRRVNSADIDTVKCSMYGLSLYDSLENARNQFAKRIAGNKRLVDKIGRYIAEGTVEAVDGVASRVHKKSGHITFHESDATDISLKFTVIDEQR